MASFSYVRDSDDDIRMLIAKARYPFVSIVTAVCSAPGTHPFGCTREKDHTGPHVAYGSEIELPLAIWGDDAD